MFYRANAFLQLHAFFCFICNSIDSEKVFYAITIPKKNLTWHPSFLNISRHVPNHSPRINTTATPRSSVTWNTSKSARISVTRRFFNSRSSEINSFLSMGLLSPTLSFIAFSPSASKCVRLPFRSSPLFISVKRATCQVARTGRPGYSQVAACKGHVHAPYTPGSGVAIGLKGRYTQVTLAYRLGLRGRG